MNGAQHVREHVWTRAVTCSMHCTEHGLYTTCRAQSCSFLSRVHPRTALLLCLPHGGSSLCLTAPGGSSSVWWPLAFPCVVARAAVFGCLLWEGVWGTWVFLDGRLVLRDNRFATGACRRNSLWRWCSRICIARLQQCHYFPLGLRVHNIFGPREMLANVSVDVLGSVPTATHGKLGAEFFAHHGFPWSWPISWRTVSSSIPRFGPPSWFTSER